MMKIICVADVHIGQKAYGKIDKETGLNEREVKTIQLLNQTVDYAINNHADVYAFAGDMYKNNLPSPTLIHYVNKAFARLSQANIQSYVCAGNHDVSKINSAYSGLAQLTALKIPNIVQDRFLNIQQYKGYQFVILPTYYTVDDITTIINNLEQKPTIIIGHLSINNSYLNDWTVIENETCVDREIFKKSFIKAVILGHFHKHQILQQEPLTMYVGSLDRIDFTEENQKKGFVELNINNDDISYKFIECTEAQKFTTLNIIGGNKSAQEIETLINNQLNTVDINNSVVRVKVQVDDEIILNEKELLLTAYNNHCQYMLKIQKILPKQELTVTTASAIDNTLTAKEALEHYYYNTKRATERINLGKEIIDSVES